MTDPKRQAIKNGIAAAQERNQARESSFLQDAGDLAGDAKDTFTQFAREHPLAMIAGGLAAGVLVSALIKRSPARKLGGKAAGLAALGAEMVFAYAQHAKELAEEVGRTGAGKLDDLGDSIGDRARGAKREAGDQARVLARKAGERLSKAIRHRTD